MVMAKHRATGMVKGNVFDSLEDRVLVFHE
jgi:hypothetical protein